MKNLGLGLFGQVFQGKFNEEKRTKSIHKR